MTDHGDRPHRSRRGIRQGARQPKGRLPRATQEILGQALRDHYLDLANEPVPASMLDLLARLETAEATPATDARREQRRTTGGGDKQGSSAEPWRKEGR